MRPSCSCRWFNSPTVQQSNSPMPMAQSGVLVTLLTQPAPGHNCDISILNPQSRRPVPSDAIDSSTCQTSRVFAIFKTMANRCGLSDSQQHRSPLKSHAFDTDQVTSLLLAQTDSASISAKWQMLLATGKYKSNEAPVPLGPTVRHRDVDGRRSTAPAQRQILCAS
ncbi:hypothetical protein K402DRAFT_238254 [Aulographum hederae CBS 113979]|uniref:Uncharacterized protein n=1 Tax=Aulographum hederae CBS 113979 TaxID=1176131 RepID=A0A6G1GKS4_9PEZI|nr:hypothetical protein K402DRAFT_238254 [Aulographum hederae CBS 113979]